jgi:hypothetical protein
MNPQSSLSGFGPEADDRFRFTWWNTREGAPCWIEHRGDWRAGVVIRRGRQYVSVALAGFGDRRGYVRRRYGDLRRRVIAPRLQILSGGKELRDGGRRRR